LIYINRGAEFFIKLPNRFPEICPIVPSARCRQSFQDVQSVAAQNPVAQQRGMIFPDQGESHLLVAHAARERGAPTANSDSRPTRRRRRCAELPAPLEPR